MACYVRVAMRAGACHCGHLLLANGAFYDAHVLVLLLYVEG
jgi:hypothetical protein